MATCDNSPCDNPAARFYVAENGCRFHLCRLCADAFELGQANAGTDLEPATEPALERDDDLPRIPAEVHSDDWSLATTFDARPWFRRAGDEEVKSLAECDWGGDYPADAVARCCAEFDEEVAAVLEYAAGKDDCGFECHVQMPDAVLWLKAHRPELAAAVACD